MPTIHNANRKLLKNNNLQALPWSIVDLDGVDRAASDDDDERSCNSKQSRNNHTDDNTTNDTQNRKRPCKSPSVIPSNLKRISDEIIWVQEGKAQHPAYILADSTTQSNDILFMSSNTVWVEWVSNGKKESIYKHQIVQDGLQARKRHRPDYFTEDPSDKSATATDVLNNNNKKARSNSPREDRETPPPVVATAKSSSKSLNLDDCSVFKNKKRPRCKGVTSILEGLDDDDSITQHDATSNEDGILKDEGKFSSIISRNQPSVSTSNGPHNEDMFQCLLNYIEETRKEETKDMNDEEKAAWVWDGSILKNYKTPSGMLLGAWVSAQQQANQAHMISNNVSVAINDQNDSPHCNHFQQKWEDMFQCLLVYVEDTRKEKTKYMNDEQKATWIWDGSIPTSYKTPSGMNLGRWITNQRAAKKNGTLKEDRDARLTSIGLKWHEIIGTTWTQMLQGLVIYAQEQQSKTGKPWDGNVPTAQTIRVSSVETVADEEKALGRWVNRQRTKYQSGKLNKEHQEELERIGLRWAARSNTLGSKSPLATDTTHAQGVIKSLVSVNDATTKSSSSCLGAQTKVPNSLKKKEKDKLSPIAVRAKKWDVKFQCLLIYIEETRKEKTKDMDDIYKAAWVWNGNVPKSYKTPSGIQLGKWVSTQRQAKKDGTLKAEREARLTNIGLKWTLYRSVSDTTRAQPQVAARQPSSIPNQKKNLECIACGVEKEKHEFSASNWYSSNYKPTCKTCIWEATNSRLSQLRQETGIRHETSELSNK